jgi:superfamily II DNA or RNA helicase
MWDQPHYTYAIVADEYVNQHLLVSVEDTVPGAMVYGRTDSGRRYRLHKVLGNGQDKDFARFEVFAPIHAAWLVEAELYQQNLGYSAETVNIDGITYWQESDEWRATMAEQGKQLAEYYVEMGELREHVPGIATPYQFMGIAWALSRPWVMDVWSCGSGKTLGAILASLTRPGPILVVCPAKARHVWWSQVQEYTNLIPYRVRPKSDMRKKDQKIEEYLSDCRALNRRPVLVVGAESLADNLSVVRGLNPSVLILDEIHTHGSRKRWTAIPQADGTVNFERRKTAASGRKNSKVDRENRAVASMDVSRLPSLQLRIGLTATPLDDGRPRRLWSQLDLLSPGGFSHSYSKFANRYCDARPGQFGGLDDTGSSNVVELKSRCSFFMHEVPYSESHAALPSTRVQVVYLSNSELNRAERWSDDKTFGQAVKSFAKEAKSGGEDARTRVVEARLAEACSRKRKYVTDEIIEGLRGGGKVVVFTARRRETEVWCDVVRRDVNRGDAAQKDVPVAMIHGGVPESERDVVVDEFRDSDGPYCIIATGQSIGTGVDGMQTADLAIFAMLPWKPGDFMQWKGRFDRLGGRATLLKVIVASGTYDERVVEILTDKFGPIESFLQADELRGLDNKLLGLEDKGSLIDSIIGKLGAK